MSFLDPDNDNFSVSLGMYIIFSPQTSVSLVRAFGCIGQRLCFIKIDSYAELTSQAFFPPNSLSRPSGKVLGTLALSG